MQFRRISVDECVGLGCRGYVRATYADLVRVFGESIGKSSDNKADAQWFLHFGIAGSIAGTKATIYNYKTGQAFLGPKAPATEQITHWHIGGTIGAVECVRAALRESKPTLNPDDPNGMWLGLETK